MGRVGFEARFRVLLRFQRFRAWLEFEARVRVLLRFWRSGLGSISMSKTGVGT